MRRLSDVVSERNMLQGLLFVVMALAGFHFLRTLVEVVIGDTLAAPLEVLLEPGEIVADYPAAASATGGTAEVEVTTGIGYRFLWWLVTDALAGPVVVFVEIIRRLLGTVDDPFVESNVSRLANLSKLAVVFLVVGLVQGFVAALIQERSGFDVGFSATLSIAPLAIVIVIDALLRMWRRGIELQLERELTI